MSLSTTMTGFTVKVIHTISGDPPTPDTRNTATQMATPSIHSPLARCDGIPAPRPVEICRQQNEGLLNARGMHWRGG